MVCRSATEGGNRIHDPQRDADTHNHVRGAVIWNDVPLRAYLHTVKVSRTERELPITRKGIAKGIIPCAANIPLRSAERHRCGRTRTRRRNNWDMVCRNRNRYAWNLLYLRHKWKDHLKQFVRLRAPEHHRYGNRNRKAYRKANRLDSHEETPCDHDDTVNGKPRPQ